MILINGQWQGGGSQALAEQIQAAGGILEENAPRRLMTVGGGCDADTASVAYLNSLYHGDLSVIWLDAHGDRIAEPGGVTDGAASLLSLSPGIPHSQNNSSSVFPRVLQMMMHKLIVGL